MGDAAAVKDKVQRYLTQNFNSVTVDQDGDFSLRHESARVFVRVGQREADAPVIVEFFVPTLLGVNDSAELHEYIAFHSDDYVFGHLGLHRQEQQSVSVLLSHRLLGDYLDEAELLSAVYAMLGTANSLDDELQAQFGGVKFHED